MQSNLLERVCPDWDYLNEFYRLHRSPWLGRNEKESNEGINMHTNTWINTHTYTVVRHSEREREGTLSFSLAFPIPPSIQTSLSELQLWERNHVFIARRGSTAEQLVVWHGRRLYLTCCDVNTWLVRFHGFSSETGRALSYQCGAETDEAVTEREGQRQTDSRQIERQADWKGRSKRK